MKPPIIINDHGDLEFYSSIELAEREVEPTDIRNNEYTFYDSEGMVMQTLIVELPGRFFGLDITVEHVRLSSSTVYRREELISALIAYLERIGHDRINLETMELQEMMNLIGPRVLHER
ncbi:MAG: hypothetical protein IPK58_10170 [Acidobacteria bacterium]|nr:hypothetical protein [Acidobacteriota bacterium]